MGDEELQEQYNTSKCQHDSNLKYHDMKFYDLQSQYDFLINEHDEKIQNIQNRYDVKLQHLEQKYNIFQDSYDQDQRDLTDYQEKIKYKLLGICIQNSEKMMSYEKSISNHEEVITNMNENLETVSNCYEDIHKNQGKYSKKYENDKNIDLERISRLEKILVEEKNRLSLIETRFSL